MYRSQSMGIASFAGRIGNLMAPFTSLMVRMLSYSFIVIMVASRLCATENEHCILRRVLFLPTNFLRLLWTDFSQTFVTRRSVSGKKCACFPNCKVPLKRNSGTKTHIFCDFFSILHHNFAMLFRNANEFLLVAEISSVTDDRWLSAIPHQMR